jgi:hypothetical protein
MEISLKSKQIIPILFGVALLLTVFNIITLYLGFHSERRMVEMLSNIFDFDYEGTIPIFFPQSFSSLILSSWQFTSGNLVSTATVIFFYWGSLSLIFCFLAFDEASRIHENLSDVFELFMDGEGLLYFLWVVPYGIATIVLGLFYLRFLLRLPSPIRNRFIIAGTIFLTGAIGFDMIGGLEAESYGFDSPFYCGLYTVEELLEMLGSIIFLSALLRHLGPISIVLELRAGLLMIKK